MGHAFSLRSFVGICGLPVEEEIIVTPCKFSDVFTSTVVATLRLVEGEALSDITLAQLNDKFLAAYNTAQTEVFDDPCNRQLFRVVSAPESLGNVRRKAQTLKRSKKESPEANLSSSRLLPGLH